MKKYILLMLSLLCLSSCSTKTPLDNFLSSLYEMYPENYKGNDSYLYICNSKFSNNVTNEIYLLNIETKVYKEESLEGLDFECLENPTMLMFECSIIHYQDNNYSDKQIINFKFKDEFSNYVKIIQKRLHKPIIVLNMRKELYIKEAKCVGSKIGPEEFLGYIYNSAYVITNSFHGMVFASLFHKKFTAFRRSEQDFRQDNLVRMLGLENRLLSINSDDLKEKDPFFLDINWERSDCLREEGARSSWDFLKNNIC